MKSQIAPDYLTVAVSEQLLRELAMKAQQRRRPVPVLALAYIAEGVRMDRYPGIIFRDRAGGRRAGLAGRRLDVWQVMETFRASDSDVEETAAYLQLRPDQVRVAVTYATDYPDEIEAMIDENRLAAERAQGPEAPRRAAGSE